MSSDIKEEIAQEAVRIVTGARRSAYGKPEQNFERIARLWNAHLVNVGLLRAGAGGMQPGDVAAFMRLMKEARLAETPDHLDSYIDLVGYSLCGAEVAGVDTASLRADAIGVGGALMPAEAGAAFASELRPWIEWGGGKRPVPPFTEVEYVMREEPNRVYSHRSGGLIWEHDGVPFDIVRYRLKDATGGAA